MDLSDIKQRVLHSNAKVQEIGCSTVEQFPAEV